MFTFAFIRVRVYVQLCSDMRLCLDLMTDPRFPRVISVAEPKKVLWFSG